MALISCALDNISNPTNCEDRGGIKTLYWTAYENIDWDTMIGDPTKFDPATHEVLEWVMSGGGTFNKVTFERKLSFYENTYTRETDVYALLLTMVFAGKDAARRLSFQKAIQCCQIVAHVIENTGKQRVFGVDYNGVTAEPILDYFQVGRHLDAGGQLGTSKSRDEIDLIGESFYAPLFAQVDESTIPLV